jgi:hypothetical protein
MRTPVYAYARVCAEIEVVIDRTRAAAASMYVHVMRCGLRHQRVKEYDCTVKDDACAN